MAEKKVRLHGSPASAFSNRVQIALNLKGVDYELFEENLPNKSPDLLKYNPVHKKIPVLVHGDKGIPESQVILEYIDEVWQSGAQLLPLDPHERASARFWARFIDDKVVMSVYKALWVGEEAAMEEAVENMKILEKELQGKRFFGGETVGFVDIVANFLGYWMPIIEETTGKVMVSEDVFPSFCRWQQEFVKCSFVKETLIPREKLVAMFQARLGTH